MDRDAARGAGAVDTGVGNVAEAAADLSITETAFVTPSIIIRLPQGGDWRALYALVRKVRARSVFSGMQATQKIKRAGKLSLSQQTSLGKVLVRILRDITLKLAFIKYGVQS